MLQSRRPSSSLRPRCPFKEAAAAEAERSARLQRGEQRPRARPARPRVGAQPCPAPGEPARSGAAAKDTPRCAQAGSPESRSRCLPVRFPVSFRSFLSNTFAPPPPRPSSSVSPPFSAPLRGRHSHREGAVLAKPLGSLRGIFAPGGGAHWAKGRRGTREEESGGQSGSGGRGRSCIGAGRLGEAGPPGKPPLGLLGRARGWNFGRRWRGGGCPMLEEQRAR